MTTAATRCAFLSFLVIPAFAFFIEPAVAAMAIATAR
jgi:hypothetical protein